MYETGVLIFDVDGTLIDAMPAHANAFAAVLEEAIGADPSLSKSEYLSTAGRPLDEQFQGMLNPATLATHDTNIPDLINRFWHLVQQQVPRAFSDTPSALVRLNAAGYGLAAISGGGTHFTRWKLHETGLLNSFFAVLGTDREVTNMVKGPGHFEILRKQLGLSTEEFRRRTALVGDAEHDMILANEARVLAIGRVTDSNRGQLIEAGAHITVDNLAELVDTLCMADGGCRTISELRHRLVG